MATKTVYQLDAHGVFVGEALAYESPLEPGVFHIPAGCIDHVPPAAAAGTAARWNGAGWGLFADRRGETWFDGAAPVVIDFVGDPAGRGYTPTAPATSPSLVALRAAAKAEVDLSAEAYRLTFITAGSGQAMAYQEKLLEAKAFLADPSLTAAECPHLYAEVGITGETAEAVAQVVVGMHAAWQFVSAAIEHKRLAAKAAIDAAETPEAISAAADVDWSTQ